MRKLIERMKDKAVITAWKAARAVENQKGEGFVDTAIKILMAVVIGALLLAGLYSLFKDTVLPTLTTRITNMFNYAG